MSYDLIKCSSELEYLEKLILIIQEVIPQNEIFKIGLTGGKTPVELYRRINSLLNQIDVDTELILLDDRLVGIESNLSNRKLIYSIFVNYKSFCPRDFLNKILPKTNVNILGCGVSDGHVMSIFTKEHSEKKSIFLTQRAHGGVKRISFPLSFLNDSALNILLIGNSRDKLQWLSESNWSPISLVENLKVFYYD